MEVLLKVPDEIVEKLEAKWADIPRHALEALVIEGYRAGILTSYEVQKTLGLATRWETDEVLKRAGAYLHYSEEDLQEDIDTLSRLTAR